MSAECITHPTDFSETAQAAEAEAIRLARAFGSVADRVVRTAKCPVLTVRGGETVQRAA